MAYNELKQRGNSDFPVDFFYVDDNHPRYFMPAHWHSEIEIIRILEGELDVKLNSTEYTAKVGDIIFVNSETVHSAVPHNGCIYECIVFHIEFLYTDVLGCKSFIDGILQGEYVINEHFPAAEGDEIHRTANKLFEAMREKRAGYKFIVVSAFYELLGLIVERQLYTASNLGDKNSDKNLLKLKKALEFIRTNFDKQISLSDISSHVRMSPKYFGSFFKGMTSKTPIQYLNEYRVEKASRKLIRTDLSITEIAFSCGFNDLSYFIKTFKRIKGISPLSFRKK